MKTALLLCIATLSSLTALAHAGPAPLVVHEWGTFTSLQDERGLAIGGINTEEERLPAFVHDLHSMLLLSPGELPTVYDKGAPRCDRDVLVRLETPVIYFHPAPGAAAFKIDVDVSFRGGWLTQYYPDAKASAPGIEKNHAAFGPLTAQTVGTLSWHDLTVGTGKLGPEARSAVWDAPRQVNAAGVTAAGGESERFLFYRGVGNLHAPLAVSRSRDGQSLQLRSQFGAWMPVPAGFAIHDLWLVDVRADGACALRTLDPVDLSRGEGRVLQTVPAGFKTADYAVSNLARIRDCLKSALLRDGLFADEADALLNTWEASYFKRPGLRLFFLVPQPWTEHYLPLRLSAEAEVRRVMVARLEIVTPEQRKLLHAINRGPASSPDDWVAAALKKASSGRQDYYAADWYRQLEDGSRTLASLGMSVPEDYRDYLQLGRFRNALVLDEAAREPDGALTRFIGNYGLEAWNAPAKPPAQPPVASGAASTR